MANLIKLKRSAVAGKAPAVGDLALGELALNTYDGKLYTKKDNGTPSIVEISGGSGGGGITGGGTDQLFVENDQIALTSYTIPTGKNASSVGPVSIDAGVTVTISANSTWVIF